MKGITSDIEYCENLGCGFNNNRKCTSFGTECFGYIAPVKVEKVISETQRVQAQTVDEWLAEYDNA